jgi:hypothetical protein
VARHSTQSVAVPLVEWPMEILRKTDPSTVNSHLSVERLNKAEWHCQQLPVDVII